MNLRRKIWYACEEHIDIILDEIVDTTALAPLMERYTGQEEGVSCSWCRKPPQYRLEIERSKE
jgi:CxxH/CxxC protein (TIGR04129 family)